MKRLCFIFLLYLGNCKTLDELPPIKVKYCQEINGQLVCVEIEKDGKIYKGTLELVGEKK